MLDEEKRDIAADRTELDAMLERAERRGDVVFPFVYGIISHYLDRTQAAEQRVAELEAERDALYAQLSDEVMKREAAESQRDHATRMVDEAIEELTLAESLFAASFPTKQPKTDWRDYLDQKATLERP